MNYKELAELISKVWSTNEDIMKLCGCGLNNAAKIRQEIEQKMEDAGKKIPPSMSKHIPTRLLVEHLGLDENYIFKMANLV